MTAYSLAEMAQASPRLARRLQTRAGSRPAEILPLIRAALVGRGYAAVAESPELAAIPADAWREHGFLAGEGQWQAQAWRPQWLEHQGTAPDEAAAHLRAPAAQLAAEPGPFLRRVRAAGGLPEPRAESQRARGQRGPRRRRRHLRAADRLG